MKYLVSILFIGLGMSLFAQREEEPKIAEVEINVSAVCGMCKDKIEKELNYTKGVVFAEVDLDEGQVHIKYKTKHLSPQKIREIIASIGYNADDVKANKEAQENLPECCKAEGCGK